MAKIFSNTEVRLNNRLISRQKLNDDDVLKIQKLHKIRNYYCDLMSFTIDKHEIRKISKIITQIDFQLQKLWKFELDESFHRWFELPKCSCPNLDNSELVGSGSRIINPKCIVHGD
jgi:hypothetical protein